MTFACNFALSAVAGIIYNTVWIDHFLFVGMSVGYVDHSEEEEEEISFLLRVSALFR